MVERDGWRGLVSIGVLPMWAEEERMLVKVRKRKEEAQVMRRMVVVSIVVMVGRIRR